MGGFPRPERDSVGDKIQVKNTATERSGVEDVRMFKGKDSCSERVHVGCVVWCVGCVSVWCGCGVGGVVWCVMWYVVWCVVCAVGVVWCVVCGMVCGVWCGVGNDEIR